MNKVKRMVIGMAAFAFAAVPAHAYVADGLLNDWGVTPFVDWTPDSPSAASQVSLLYGGPNHSYNVYDIGGPVFKAYAGYEDDTEHTVNFAFVTAFPQSGVPFPDGNNGVIETGDIGLHLYGNSGLEYGIRTTGADFGKLYLNPTWTLPDANVGYPEDAPSNFTGGTYVGTVDLAYVNTGTLHDGVTTYVIEGSVDKHLLNDPLVGNPVEVRWAESCGNDWLDVQNTIQHPIPEPATLSLLGIGLAGFGLKRREKSS